jgi:hypothetical protein
MVAYEFYCCLKTGAEQLIGILPERRTDSGRVTRQSITAVNHELDIEGFT